MLEPQVTGIPLPHPTPTSRPYWEGTKLGELRYQVCDRCAAANFGPGIACSSCQTIGLSWAVSEGRGTLYSWTEIGRPPVAAFEAPYVACIARLAEGYDMVSALIGCELSDIVADMPIVVEFHRASADITLPFFKPAQ